MFLQFRVQAFLNRYKLPLSGSLSQCVFVGKMQRISTEYRFASSANREFSYLRGVFCDGAGLIVCIRLLRKKEKTVGELWCGTILDSSEVFVEVNLERDNAKSEKTELDFVEGKMIPEKLLKLSEEIQEAEQGLREFYRQGIMNGNQSGRLDVELLNELEKYAIIFLRASRIHMCLTLIGQGQRGCRDVFREDWKKIIDCLLFLEETDQISDATVSNAVDLILLLDPGKKGALYRQLGFFLRHRIHGQAPMKTTTIFCGLNMVEYCVIKGRQSEACSIAQNLIALSEERNVSKPDMHREILRRSLAYIVDIDPQLTKRLCEQHEAYRKEAKGLQAADLEWFYAFSLLRDGQSGTACEHFWNCHKLCLDAEGEFNWLGAKAGIFCHMSLLEEDTSGELEAFLWDALQKIDDGYYLNMGDEAEYFTSLILHALLHIHMVRQSMDGLLPQIQRLHDNCRRMENVFGNLHLTVRNAENILASYYCEQCNFLLASKHALNALTVPVPEGIQKYPSDDVLLSNLLVICTRMNDADQMIKLQDILSEKIDAYSDVDPMVCRIATLLVVSWQKLGYPLDEFLGEFREALIDFAEDMDEIPDLPDSDEGEEEAIIYAMWVLVQADALLQSFPSDAETLELCCQIAQHFLCRPHRYHLGDAQHMVCYHVLALSQWLQNHPDMILSTEKWLEYGKRLHVSREERITALRCAAVRYYSIGRADLAIPVETEAFSCITAAWRNAVSYLNDHKICQLLSVVQNDFNFCYAVFRQTASAEAMYRQLIQFKDLPALVGRERNRFLRLAPVDEALKANIFSLQNQLAAARMNDSLMGTDTADQLARQLTQAEADFAAQFPQNMQFTSISLDRLCEKLPNRTAILEYYFVPGEKTLHGRPVETDIFELDLFVLAKRAGKPALHHFRLSQGDQIIDEASELWKIMQEALSPAQSRRKEALRNSLFDTLIVPALTCLDGISTLMIAPDLELCNLPFEILKDHLGQLLSEKFHLCRLVCGRDLLFSEEPGSEPAACFLLGDPDYEAEKGELFSSLDRDISDQLVPVQPLPFSRIEVQRIGAKCHTTPLVASKATKYALQDALPCRIIHLATHGVFDISMESDSLYTSYLVFAGYNKWVTRQKESKSCGNGILTADEISRMDLRQTELVVLSACQSGLGDTSYRSVQGMLSAFSAAGVHWVISHMWKASDFATPILMDAFYDAYLFRGMDVPDALQYAKQYLRGITVGELREKGWLDLQNDLHLDDPARKELEQLRQCRIDRRRVFEDVFYWGGFVCHKCR